jgi:hypothetical protein
MVHGTGFALIKAWDGRFNTENTEKGEDEDTENPWGGTCGVVRD